MLVLSRKPGEQVVIGDKIRLTVVEVRGNRVKIGIEAPADVEVYRSELREWQEPSLAKSAVRPGRLPRAGRLRLIKTPAPATSACTTAQ